METIKKWKDMQLFTALSLSINEGAQAILDEILRRFNGKKRMQTLLDI